MFIAGLGKDWRLPLVLMLLSLCGVFTGLLLRIRSFLLLGIVFLLLDLVAMIWYAAVDLEQTWLWYVCLIALGAGIIALFALFEKRRNDLLLAVAKLKQWQRVSGDAGCGNSCHTATTASSLWCFASARRVSSDICIVTLQRPSLSASTSQCGITTTDWWTSSKPPSDWLTVSMGKVQKSVGRDIFRPTSSPSHSSVRPRPKASLQVELRAELAEHVAVDVGEVAAVGVGGHAGEVQLDGEMQRPVGRAGFPAGRPLAASSCRRRASGPW